MLADTPQLLGNPTSLVGLSVVGVRRLSAKDLGPDWDDFLDETVLELSDGTLLFASRDCEGNGPGAFYRASKDDIVPCVLMNTAA